MNFYEASWERHKTYRSISRVDFIHDAHTKQNTPKQNPKTALHVHKMLQHSNVENCDQHHFVDETVPVNMKETDF